MIRLIVDSTFGLTKEYAEKNNIEIVRLKMILGEDTFEEGFEDSWVDFYEKMKTSKIFPTTSQPSPQDFMDAIDKIYREDNNAEILILTISQALSGTINAATIAANSYENKNIVVHDSNQAATASRILAEETVDLINSGKTFKEILDILPSIEDKIKIQFVPDNMTALKKGGRIGILSAAIADILKIKPLFEFSHGKIKINKKVLGLGRAITDAIAMLPKKLKKLYVVYIYDKVNVPMIVSKLKSILGIENVEVISIEPVFGVHVGIGGVGIASLGE